MNRLAAGRATRSARLGSASAQRPNAASTWSQPVRWASQSAISSNGSKAPVLTSPAWAQISTGPSRSGSRSARSRPCSSAGTTWTRRRPSPTSPSDFLSVECAPSPTTTSSGGAPNSPSDCTSQPSVASSASLAAARQAALATVAPVTKARPVSAGSREQVDEPAAHDVVQLVGDRRHHRQAGVLVPRARPAMTCRAPRGRRHPSRTRSSGLRSTRSSPDCRRRRAGAAWPRDRRRPQVTARRTQRVRRARARPA